MHIELIGIDGSLNDGFAQTVAGRHEDNLIKAAFSIKREHHAGSTLVGAAHALHAGRQSDLGMGKSFVDAVADGTVVVKRSKHFLHARENLIDAHDIEVGFLLTGERSIRKVFCGRRRANGNRDFFLPVLEPFVKSANFLFEFGRKRRFLNPFADVGACLSKCFDILNIKPGQALGDAVFKTAFLQKKTEGFSSRGKAVGNTDAGARKLTEQFAERSILSADAVDVRHAKLTKRKNIAALNHLNLCICSRILFPKTQASKIKKVPKKERH